MKSHLKGSRLDRSAGSRLRVRSSKKAESPDVPQSALQFEGELVVQESEAAEYSSANC